MEDKKDVVKFSSYTLTKIYDKNFDNAMNIGIWKGQMVMEFYEVKGNAKMKLIMDASDVYIFSKLLKDIIKVRTNQFLQKTPYTSIPAFKINNKFVSKDGNKHDIGSLLITSESIDGVERVIFKMTDNQNTIKIPLYSSTLAFDNDNVPEGVDIGDLALYNLGLIVDNFSTINIPIYAAANHIIKNIWDSVRSKGGNSGGNNSTFSGGNNSPSEEIPF